MSLDLFFVPKKPAFSELRAEGFVPTPAMTRARRKIVGELVDAHPGARLEGDATRGWLDDFPPGGLLSFLPGYISWALHNVGDTAPVHELVNWFHARGWVCEDPQDAGFGNRNLKRNEQRRTLQTFDELVGAQFVGVRLLREWVRGLATHWELPDGSSALVQFVHFNACTLADLGALLTRRVIAVDFQTGNFDTLRVFFEDNHELNLNGAVFHKSEVVGPKPARV